jgi:HEAT repeat protein
MPISCTRLLLAAPLVLLAGCAQHVGTTATSFMKHVRENPDPNLRHLAYARLADPNCYLTDEQMVEAANLLGQRLDAKDEPTVTRAIICRTLGELKRPEGAPALRRACDDLEPVVRGAACRALGKLGDPEDLPILARIMAADSDPDCRIAAIEGLGNLPSADTRCMQSLVDGMQSPDPAIRLASYDSLQKLAGRDLGPDPGPWKAYVDEQVRTASAATPAESAEPPAAPPSADVAAPTLDASVGEPPVLR